MPAVVTLTGAVNVDLIPADVQWIADVKLDRILSCHIVALGQHATTLISPPFKWQRMPLLRTG